MNTPLQSPLNPRDFVELLDCLIMERMSNACNFERAELLKRQLTDYLLDIDKRPGVYVKGENETRNLF